jgi:hypothetical protein
VAFMILYFFQDFSDGFFEGESSSSTKQSSRRFYLNDLNAKMSMALLAPSFHHLKKCDQSLCLNTLMVLYEIGFL